MCGSMYGKESHLWPMANDVFLGLVAIGEMGMLTGRHDEC